MKTAYKFLLGVAVFTYLCSLNAARPPFIPDGRPPFPFATPTPTPVPSPTPPRQKPEPPISPPTDNYIQPRNGERYTLALDLLATGHIRAEIYTTRGELVKTLINAELPAGPHHVIWDGKNENGEDVSSDLYFIRIYLDKKLKQKKKVIIEQ